jgi:hypothetical protein
VFQPGFAQGLPGFPPLCLPLGAHLPPGFPGGPALDADAARRARDAARMKAYRSNRPVQVCGYEGCAYQTKNTTHLKLHRAALHGIGETPADAAERKRKRSEWDRERRSKAPHKLCGYNGCTYKSKYPHDMKRHKEAKHEIKGDPAEMAAKAMLGLGERKVLARGTRLCEVDGCRKLGQGGTPYCIGHGGGKRCTAEGCTKGARGKLFCAAHGGGRRCEGGGCAKSARSNSKFCVKHGREAGEEG